MGQRPRLERRRPRLRRPRRRDAEQLSAPGPAPREIASPWAFAGIIGLASVFFLLAATPTVVAAPWWVTALMLLVWAVALVQGCRWFVRRPRAVVVLPVLLAVGWFAVVLGGARWLDWA